MNAPVHPLIIPSDTYSEEQGNHLGVHILAEFVGTQQSWDVDQCEDHLQAACRSCGATVLDSHVNFFISPTGEKAVTGVVSLSESHLSIHTWPEHRYCSIDIYTCGKIDPFPAIQYLKRLFEPSEVFTKSFFRGVGVEQQRNTARIERMRTDPNLAHHVTESI